MPDDEIATLAGDTAAHVSQYRYKYGIPAYQAPAPVRTGRRRLVRPERAPKEASPAPAVSASPARPRRPRRSALDAYRGQLGQLPDAVVAQKAKVSVQAVRLYRRKHGIALDPSADQRRGRGDQAPESTAREEQAAPRVRRARRSKLDPFRAQIGQGPDREIAEQAGVTVAAVQQYRRAHGIPAAGRIAREGGAPPAPSVSETGGAGQEAAKETLAVSRGLRADRGLQGYAAVVEQDGQRREFFLVAAGLLEALRQVDAAQAAGQAQGEVVAVRVLGPALG